MFPLRTEKPSLFVEKTAQPDEDGGDNLGDEIHYVIKVTNNGNVTVNDITVKDELTGDEWQLTVLLQVRVRNIMLLYCNGRRYSGRIYYKRGDSIGTDPDEDPVDQEGEETVPTDSADLRI